MDTNKRWKFDEEEWKDKFNKAFDEALEKWRLSWTDGSMDHQTTTTKKWGAVRKVHSDSTRHSEFDKEEVNNVEANWKLGYAVKVFDKSPERALEEERDKEEVNDVEAMCQLGYAVKVCDGSPERVFTSTGTQPDFAPPINSHFNGYAKFGKGNDVGGHGEVTTNIWGSYKDGGSGGGPGQGRIRTLALPRFDRTNSDGWKYDQNTGQWYQVDGWDATTSVAGNFDTAVHNEATEVSYLQQTSQSSLGTILQNGSTQSVTNWNQTSHVGEAAALASNCNQVPSSNTEYPSHMYFDPQYPGWYYDTIVQEWRSLDTYIPSTQAAVQSKNHLNQNGFTSIGFSLSHEDKAKSWYSPSGDFASGFTKVQDQILFSIWFDKIPDKPIVWFVNDGTTVPAGSKVQLTADRGLFLSDSKGKGVWRSVISGTASNGVFNDTGNFIIFGSSSTKLWDSFSYQTDTLLPTHLRETNFTKGRFQLRFLENGNLVLNSRDILTNYAYGPYDEDDIPDINASMLKFSTTGYMYIVDRNGSAVNLTENGAVPSAGYYHRAILHFDGILVQYYHPKNITGSTNWTSALHIPKNICLKSLDIQGSGSSGACGFNSVGTLDNSRRVDCECPESYSLVDPNDKYGDCKTNATQNCIGYSQDFYDLTESTDTDWPFSDYAHLNPISEFECRMQCLNDCFCAVAIYREDSCWKKKLPLSNGKKDPSINSKAFLKYSKVDLPPKSRRDNPGAGNIVRYREKEKGTLILVGSVLLGSSVIVNFMLIVVACFGFFYIYNKKTVNLQPANSSVETDVRRFTSHELVEATNGFKEEWGRGSFGIIYKGVIQMSSSIVVTVKKIDSLIQDGAKEFKTEVNVIAQTHHKNLVRLVGYCEEEEHHLLVYEYMVNGTLVSFLFSSVKPSWALRKHIALGIARGLAYLHEECSTKIFHCDIKPQNILLGELYNARISDFGPAKLLMLNQSRTNTGIRGTKGYVAPEWFRNTPVTVKVDVYSYGVLLLEINCCRKSVEDPEFGEKAILTDWVWDCFRDGRTVDLVENDNEVEYNLGPDFKSSGYNLKEDVKFLPIYGLYSSNFQKSESEDACNIVRWLWYDLPRRQWRPGEEHDEF